MYVCIYTCIYVCTQIYIHIYIYEYTYTHTHIIYTHTHTYIGHKREDCPVFVTADRVSPMFVSCKSSARVKNERNGQCAEMTTRNAQ